jgi:hypothetical protein
MQVGDLAYHLRAGTTMWATREILRRDIFTFTMRDAPWLNQQWGAQLVLARLFDIAGWRGLIGVRALVVAACFATAFWMARRVGADAFVAGALTIGSFAVAATLPGALAMRPQLLVLPLFLAVLWLLHTRATRPTRVWWIVPIGVVWANLHGSFLLVPLLCLLALVEDRVRRRGISGHLVAVAAGSSLAGLFTPWGAATYGYVVEVATHPLVRGRIDEWQPLWRRWPAGVAFAVAIAAIAVVLRRHRDGQASIWGLLTFIALCLLAVSSGRHLIWWALATPLLVGSALDPAWRPGSEVARTTRVVIAVAIAAGIALAGTRVVVTDPVEALLGEAPPGVTRAVERTGADRVFNAWWGSWFEYAIPEVATFVDTRVEFFDERIWDGYFLVIDAGAGWREVLDGWDIGVVAASRDRHPSLVLALEADDGWRLVHEDADGVVFVRRSAAS